MSEITTLEPDPQNVSAVAIRFAGDSNRANSTVRGHLADHRVTVIKGNQRLHRNLNTHLDLTKHTGSDQDRKASLSQPMAMEISADFIGNTQKFALNKLSVALGESQLSGTLEVSMLEEKPSINLKVASEYIDIRPFTQLNEAVDETVDETNASNDSGRLIPPTPLPLDALAAIDITLNITIAELRHEQDSLENIRLEAVVDAGHLDVSKLSFEGPRGGFGASFSITPIADNHADVQLDLSANKLSLNLSGQPDEKLENAPAVDILLHVSGSGGNLQQVAGSVNGSLLVGSQGGSVEGVDLSVLDTFILDEIFSLILPKSDSKEDLNLTCAATIVKISDGLMETDPAFAFTTDKITLVAKGTLDLKTEKMRMNFNATPNNALKLSAGELFNPYILVGGTLSKPQVGLDPGKVLIHGGAAIGTAGLSILAKGLIDRVNTAIPLCEEMLAQVQPRTAENPQASD